MALLIASMARSEMHVTLVGAIVVLALAFVGGCILPRDMMPEGTETVTRLTPHGWALDAYQEMFRANPKSPPKGAVVATSCSVLAAFGAGFLALSWWRLKLD
jgi:ABC-2 type transport system permease protein